MTYEFKTTPFKHQSDTFELSAYERAFAVFWEQGTGKTKLIIDTTSNLYEQDEIDAMLIVAPPGVDLNWVTDELPAHMPERVLEQANIFQWRPSKAATKYHIAAAQRLLHHRGLSILCMSYDAFMTKKGKNFAWKFFQKRKVFQVLDEAHAIKSPGAKRTISLVASGRHAKYRRILTGTPIANGPFDIYSQMKFIQEDFWKQYGFHTFAEFKEHFGVFDKQAVRVGGELKQFDVLVEYRHLDELYEILAKHSSRVTKDEVLDLPPKLYTKKYFELNREQQIAYRELRDEYMTEVKDGSGMKCRACNGSGVELINMGNGNVAEEPCSLCGGYGEGKIIVDAPLAIVRLLRLQQVTCGYLPTGEEDRLVPLGNSNPRLDALKEIIEPLGHKSIIWARFNNDVDQIMHMLEAIGRKPVRYDGKVSNEVCAQSKHDFQNGDATDFVATQSKGATGLTLTAARTVIYFNNTFKLIDRLQSEDRPHRIGQDHPVNYIDIVAEETVDIGMVNALRSKFDIATQITGDRLREWI